MAVISLNQVTKIRDERELDILAQNGNCAGIKGEIEAYNICLKLLESFGKKVTKVVNARLVDLLEISDATKRRASHVMAGINAKNDMAIKSSEEKTMMLEYLRGHMKAVEKVVRLLSEG